MRRAAAIASFGVVAAAFVVAPARAQQRPPSEWSETDVHRVRGHVAWRRAAWRLRRDEWVRAAAELEAARQGDAAGGKGDLHTLFLLGVAYLRMAQPGVSREMIDKADIALSQARSLDPDAKFPGFAFADALRETVLPEGPPAQSKARVEAAVAKFNDFIRDFGRPEDLPFGQELLFLGHFYRGRSRSRVGESRDAAVADLVKATGIAEANRQTPPTEVVSLLAQTYKSLDQIEDAKRVVSDAVKRDPAEATNYYNYAQLLFGAHDLTGARAWFEAALQRRPDFPEARLALADVARKVNEPATMRRHLEAAAALQEMAAKAGAPVDADAKADLECGFGIFWKLVGDQRAEAGDDAGMRDAFARAKARFLSALSNKPGCFNAFNHLIQMESRMGAPQAEVDALKARLDQLQKPAEGEAGAFRSTFC